MPRWRKMTWAILIWSALFLFWGISGAAAVGDIETTSAAESAGVAIGAGIGFTFIFMVWFLGFIIMSIVWFMTRPKSTVLVYGPQGQQATVPESEARKRVEKQGWSYTPPAIG